MTEADPVALIPIANLAWVSSDLLFHVQAEPATGRSTACGRTVVAQAGEVEMTQDEIRRGFRRHAAKVQI